MAEQKKIDREKDLEEIKSALSIKLTTGHTHLIGVVIDNGDPSRGILPRNSRQRVRCYHGMAFTEGYPYDQSSDSYLISCVDSLYLGHAVVGCEISIPDIGGWSSRIPLPQNIISKYFTSAAKERILGLIKKYPSPRFSVEIMQMIGCET